MSPLSAEPQVRSANIFINYRREDSAGHAGRLFDGLSSHFPGRLFMDVDTIAPGIDFVEAIEQAVGACEVLIVVIGREWLSLKNATGGRRIDDSADFVRLELETALARNIRIIPVLVQDAQPPRPEDLPPSLARLARRNAIELSDVRWGYDVERLAQTIQGVLGQEVPVLPKEKLRVPPVSAPERRLVKSRTLSFTFTLTFALSALLLVSTGWITKNPFQSAAIDTPLNPKAVQAQPGPAPVPVQPNPAPVEPVPSPRPSPEKPDADIKPFEPSPAPIHAGPAPAHPAPAPVPAPSPKPADIKPVEPRPSPVETLPAVTITSPKNGDTADNCVTVSGVISELGSGQHAFLGFRTQGVVYPRGELHPSADGRWSITTESSHHDFDILVVITTSPEAAEAVNDPWRVPPQGAHIAPTSVSMRTSSHVIRWLKSKCGKNGS